MFAEPIIQEDSRSIRLSDLFREKLPEPILGVIGEVELTIDDIADWERSKPAFRMEITESEFSIEIRKRVATKRMLLTLGSLITATWTIIEFLLPFLSRLNGLP